MQESPGQTATFRLSRSQATTGIPTTVVEEEEREGLFLISSLFQMSFFLIYAFSWQEGAKRKAGG